MFDKAREEIQELEVAIEIATGGGEGSGVHDGSDKIRAEYGDFLFVVANLARHLKIDPERALRQTCAKFIQRFGEIELALASDGRTLEQSSLEEMDELWNRAKARENTG